MAPLEETGKRKAARIPLDYHKRPDLLARGRFWLMLLALVLAGGWAFFATRHPASALSPGPVAVVHATWEDQCAACHVPFTSIRADAVNLSGKPGSVADDRCQACHRGPPHHTSLKPGEMGRCSSCHSEHLGRGAAIARTDDRVCINCHNNLPVHTLRPETLIASGPFANLQVTAFGSQNHPQFRSTASDPGKLKFSHRRHLAPGLNLGAGDRFPAQKLKDLAAADRDQYRAAGQQDDDVIRLDCAACHQLQAAASHSSSGRDHRPATQPTTGAYMLPIKYEDHCQACHRLNYEPESTHAKSPRSLPHGLQPSEIEQFLQAVYTNSYFDSDPDLLKPTPSALLFPGELPPAKSPVPKAAIREKVNRADTYLRGRCQECHELAGMPTQAAVEPTRVPSVWFEHARFDHLAHRAVACRVCHGQEYLYQPWTANSDSPALDNRDVLMPRLEVCVGCHAPRHGVGAGGARFDCVECHIYHAADDSGGAGGADSRGASQRWQLDEFLRGPAPAKTP